MNNHQFGKASREVKQEVDKSIIGQQTKAMQDVHELKVKTRVKSPKQIASLNKKIKEKGILKRDHRSQSRPVTMAMVNDAHK